MPLQRGPSISARAARPDPCPVAPAACASQEMGRLSELCPGRCQGSCLVAVPWTERPAQRPGHGLSLCLCHPCPVSSTRTCQRRCAWRPWSCVSRPVRNSPTTTRYCHECRRPLCCWRPLWVNRCPSPHSQLQRALQGPWKHSQPGEGKCWSCLRELTRCSHPAEQEKRQRGLCDSPAPRLRWAAE